MSLYHEASQVLESIRMNVGSIKSTIFAKKTWKSDPRALFALTTEASKWSEILSEVIEHSGVLKAEKQLTPTLALLLAHDLLLAKKGVALPQTHGLSTAISRYKARLTAELTKSRLRRGFPSLDTLRTHINDRPASGNGVEAAANAGALHPRWIRINTVRTSLEEQLESTFADFAKTTKLHDITDSTTRAKLLYIDKNVPDLIAIPPHIDVVSENAYKEGNLILQDKASCFPALLLDPSSINGDIIDACAAPGNKTTHLAALATSTRPENGEVQSNRKIFACERDALRSQTLAKMVKLAGAEDTVHIKAKQDFMKLNPQSKEFANVTCLLLDPSCSGSGIVGRNEAAIEIHLPDATKSDDKASRGKKRKRNGPVSQNQPTFEIAPTMEIEEVPAQLPTEDSKLQDRLAALSAFQLRLLQHAMAFSAAQYITYSTCSLYDQENEHVVVKALLSEVARERGWRILRREHQVQGLRSWKKRGSLDAVADILGDTEVPDANLDGEVIADACIRCEKNSEDGTMGFFVAGFVRDARISRNMSTLTPQIANGLDRGMANQTGPENGVEEDEDEWSGFSDDDS